MEIDRVLLSASSAPALSAAPRANAAGPPRGDRGVAGHRQPAGGRLGAARRSARGRADRPGRPGHAAVRRPVGRARLRGRAQRRPVHPVPGRAVRLLAAAARLRCRRGSLQRHAVPGAAVVPQAGICMVNHVHTDLWPLRFRPPLSTAGRFLEQRVMPWAAPPQPGAHGVRVHRAGTGVARGPARAHPHAHQRRRPGGPAGPALRRAAVPRARPGSPSTSGSTCCCACGTGSARSWAGA